MQSTKVLYSKVMKEVLFVCWSNSARSQMAEAFLRHYGAGKFEAYSAGIETAELALNAIKVMLELGIDISKQTSKTLDQYIERSFDEVITLCDSANQVCPFFSGAKNRQHWEFDDPAKATGTDEEVLQVFRNVRDAIKAKIEAELLS